MAFEYADKVEDFFVGGLQFIKGFFTYFRLQCGNAYQLFSVDDIFRYTA